MCVCFMPDYTILSGYLTLKLVSDKNVDVDGTYRRSYFEIFFNQNVIREKPTTCVKMYRTKIFGKTNFYLLL